MTPGRDRARQSPRCAYQTGWGCGRALRDLADETITTTRNGRDVFGAVTVAIECLAKDEHLLVEVRFLDDRVSPDSTQDFVLGQDAIALLHEQQQEIEGSGRKCLRNPGAEQHALGRIKNEWREFEGDHRRPPRGRSRANQPELMAA